MGDLKLRLRNLFEEFSSFAKWKYGNSHEVTIYNRLMQYEQSRLDEAKPPVRILTRITLRTYIMMQKQASVRERTERKGQTVDLMLGKEGATMQFGEKKEKEERPR